MPSPFFYECPSAESSHHTCDSKGDVEDHETYYLNLTNANANPKELESLTWEREYSAREAYNLTALSADQWNNMVGKMLNDGGDDKDEGGNVLFESYYNHYHRFSDAMPRECTGECKQNILAPIRVYDPFTVSQENFRYKRDAQQMESFPRGER